MKKADHEIETSDDSETDLNVSTRGSTTDNSSSTSVEESLMHNALDSDAPEQEEERLTPMSHICYEYMQLLVFLVLPIIFAVLNLINWFMCLFSEEQVEVRSEPGRVTLQCWLQLLIKLSIFLYTLCLLVDNILCVYSDTQECIECKDSTRDPQEPEPGPSGS